MQAETYNVIWLDRSQRVSIHELIDLSGMTEHEIHELVEFGALAPLNTEEFPLSFSADCVVTVRKASRLRDDLELDSHALVLALTLLEQIRTLEAELAQLRARQPVFGRF
jgi:chaperone modulatory protein CbpM